MHWCQTSRKNVIVQAYKLLSSCYWSALSSLLTNCRATCTKWCCELNANVHVATDVAADEFLYSYQWCQINKHGFDICGCIFTFYGMHSVVCTSHVSARKNDVCSVKCQGSGSLKTFMNNIIKLWISLRHFWSQTVNKIMTFERLHS